ncbi:uncharacterized protein J7T54_007862 [Emericellopsis cladophorae]|uniref:ADF-H domain-containing protein n=1 Tax=Emericellopsis cladophorae TaxID=2686198 RepID=A0A9P9Y8K3_9HYPO|nr:uncharacterized protein J7T54_007862 [Emericellopsis cladophorae]KAI6784769.1 hypothetical protein J7T54_007862 [Emericellopsis cladophorae]
MSLNGLDDPQVATAFAAAAAEAGGWFLLKYASRDEVEILSHGTGGIGEMRNAIAEYEDSSPLYGYLKYRRRNVLIKYLPEDCSRLIQARVAVHFNAVCERFAPYDSQFDITAADELRDTKLSAACSLHAASGSNSSSGSLRKKHLMEIVEEDEEELQPPSAKRQSLVKDKGDNEKHKPEEPPVTLNSDLADTQFSAEATSEVPNFVGTTDEPSADPEPSRRMSSQSGRTDVYTSYSAYSSYSTKPKVKLGPRPSLETSTRPQTAGNFRPVSSIPAGFKLFGKGSTSSKKSGRKDSVESANDSLIESPLSEATDTSVTTLPIPEEPSAMKTPTDNARPATSSGASFKSSMTSSSKPAMTPEKARLKKAMQMRERKRKAAGKASEVPDVPEVPVITTTEVTHGQPSEQTSELEQGPIPMAKADSGVAIDVSPASTKDSMLTQDSSRPASPAETQQSTKASSIDESGESEGAKALEAESLSATSTPITDRTVQEDEGSHGEEAHVNGNGAASSPAEARSATSEDTATQLNDSTAQTVATSVDDQECCSESVVAASANDVDGSIPSHETTGASTSTLTQAAHTDDMLAHGHEKATVEDRDHRIQQDIAGKVPAAIETPGTDDDAKLNDQVSDTETISPPLQPSRRRPVEPIRTDLAQHSRPTSQAFSVEDDESLLDEIHSATVEEAKPMFVAKTPVTPVFPGKLTFNGGAAAPASATAPSFTGKPTMVRTVSNPVRGNLVAPPSDVSQSSMRSLSHGAAYLHQITQQRNGDNLSKKGGNLGSSISQRIKALELLSVHEGTAAAPGSRPSSTFFQVNKDRVPSRSPSVVDRTNSLRDVRPSTAQSRDNSPDLRFHRERSGSISSRLSKFEPTGSPGNQPRGRPETVSVTAKIVRDSPSQSQTPEGHLDLKQSPLLVDHQRAPDTPDVTVEPPAPEPSPERQAADMPDPRRSSFSIMRDFIKDGRKNLTSPSTDNVSSANGAGPRSPGRPALSTQHSSSSSIANRLSISSRRSLSKDRDGMSSILSDDESVTSEKKASRASRIMRRLSSLSGTSKNKASSPMGTPMTVTEEKFPSATASDEGPGIASYMGDVNVQFPDTLLWKRRNMYLDTQGYVVLSTAPQQSQRPTTAGAGVKRYHLGEFRTPYAPDVEVQELPNSVVLDLVEGSSVQVACEDRAGQMNVLQILQDAHAAYAGQ